MYIHSFLHQWSIVSYDGDLNVKGQNLEVGKILKYDEINSFFDGELIIWSFVTHYLRYLQSYVDYFTKFIEIGKFGAETDFCKFGFVRREMEIEYLICWYGRVIISISANNFVNDHLYHNINFSIFWIYLHFPKFSTCCHFLRNFF